MMWKNLSLRWHQGVKQKEDDGRKLVDSDEKHGSVGILGILAFGDWAEQGSGCQM